MGSGRTADRVFRLATGLCAAAVGALMLVADPVHGQGLRCSRFKDHGFGFILSPEWDPTNQKYGALTFLFGTAYTSLIGMAIALPLARAHRRGPGRDPARGPAKLISLAVELLAAIPSVLLGLWGIFELVPLVRKFEILIYKSHSGLRELPIFSGPRSGSASWPRA